jgi:hypothetical protein
MIESSSYQLLLNEPILGIVFMGMCALILIVGLCVWGNVRKTQSNNRLKRDMLDRGMSVDDIERVINAGAESEGAKAPQL